MKASSVVSVVVVLLVLLGIWYWASNYAAAPAVSPASTLEQGATSQTGSEATATVGVASTAVLGEYLVASNGMTLYRYTRDTPGVSNCSGTCAVNWPPYVRATTGPLTASNAATGTLATITRPDGTMQITYNDMPLYFWKDDKKPGDTSGQNVGGVWFVVNP